MYFVIFLFDDWGGGGAFLSASVPLCLCLCLCLESRQIYLFFAHEVLMLRLLHLLMLLCFALLLCFIFWFLCSHHTIQQLEEANAVKSTIKRIESSGDGLCTKRLMSCGRECHSVFVSLNLNLVHG